MQIKHIYIKTILVLLLVVFITLSCNNNSPKDNAPTAKEQNSENCILQKSLSRSEVLQLENKLGSQTLSTSKEEIHYQHSAICDSLEHTVEYKFSNDSLIKIRYHWQNLPGRNDELNKRLTQILAILEKRSGKPPRVILDENRKYIDVSTRIDFDDVYFWDKTEQVPYAAGLYFHDSGRSGESALIVDLDFSDN